MRFNSGPTVVSMSRLKNFTRSLLSGYVLMGVNILYTFFSVPLVLSYLSKSQFGLWGVVGAMAEYIALVDLGVSGSVYLILVDHKDDRANKDYGSLIQTSFLVNIVQGLIVLF